MSGENQQLRGPGRGSVRVGVWIGRLGVVSLPAVSVGLGIEERVLRRHVARLEAAGWLGRAPGRWGEGSVVWLTVKGLGAVGLGGLGAVRASPAPSAILADHSTRVAWSAARVQRKGLYWLARRELRLERERWEIAVLEERGWATKLPDLAVWLPNRPIPIAIVIEAGQRRADRQKAILGGWRAAIATGRYAAVRYDCPSHRTVQSITRLAERARLHPPQFRAIVQMSAEEVQAIPFAEQTATEIEAEVPAAPESPPAAVSAPPAPEPTPTVSSPLSAPQEPAESPEQTAERQRYVNEILGRTEPKPHRRWRR